MSSNNYKNIDTIEKLKGELIKVKNEHREALSKKDQEYDNLVKSIKTENTDTNNEQVNHVIEYIRDIHKSLTDKDVKVLIVVDTVDENKDHHKRAVYNENNNNHTFLIGEHEHHYNPNLLDFY